MESHSLSFFPQTRKKRLVRIFLLFIFLFFGAPLFASAETNGFSFSPPFQEVTISENGNASFPVMVENHTSTLATFQLSVLDFGSLNESGGVAFVGGTNNFEKKYALASWMHPASDTLTIAAGETGTTTVNIENRDDLSPGGHYAALILKNTGGADPASLQNGIAIDQIFSILVFVKKVGGEKYGLEFSGKEWTRNLMTLPTKITLRFQNTGNVHIVPRGTLSVRDPRGGEVAQGVINEASSLLLPESFRIFPETMIRTKTAFFPGQYTFTLQYRYDGKDDFTTREERFFYVPPVFLGAFFTGLVLLIGYFRFKKAKKK